MGGRDSSQRGALSSRASLDLRFDLLVRRAALVSANSSWRTYPVRVGGELGLFHGSGGLSEGAAGALTFILYLMLLLNLVLFFFNLIPIPPLDGSGAIGLFLSEENARRLQLMFLQPGFAMAGMIFAYFFGGRLISPLVFWTIDLFLG